jgi:inositol-phosphate phosphatase / L-galactose 1-phosphate phosphatase / histidinol-phosphatase
MTTPVDAALIAFANELADAAGGIVRRYFRRGIAVDDKADMSPVTIADREAESALRGLIEKRFPDHGILGEEHGSDRADAERVWVLDPIDGTKSFISGVPLFGTLIALVERGVPVLGVIDQPISRERWIGARGHKSTLNDLAISTRACPALQSATLFATSPDMFKGADADAFQRLKSAVKLPRFGGDCYAYGLLAAGFIDLVVEAGLKPYDYAALVPVIVGAGGSMTDWQGRPLSLASDGHVLACGDPRLAPLARGLLAGRA